MKYIYVIIVAIFISLMIFGCDIEGKIDNASTRCEDKIDKIFHLLESVEDICLTKEEILELINSVQNFEDTESLNETACGEE